MIWAVSHDPCRRGDRFPLGAVPVGERVRVILRVDCAARSAVASAAVRVGQRLPYEEGCSWSELEMSPCDQGFCGEFDLEHVPHVAFYAFVLYLADESKVYYVPRADGRASAGEVVKSGPDGKWTQRGWAFSRQRLAELEVDEEGAFCLAEPLPGFQVTVFDPAFSSPEWMAGAVMYQIFPDRFARGENGVRVEGFQYHEQLERPVHLHENWNEPVEWLGPEVFESPAEVGGEDAMVPGDISWADAVSADDSVGDDASSTSGDSSGIDAESGYGTDGGAATVNNVAGEDAEAPSDTAEEGAIASGDAANADRTPDGEDVCSAGLSQEAQAAQSLIARRMKTYDPIDFFGGTLEGIRQKLGYLASLGVEVLYLNPIFEARSNHRYDTADYEHIEPILGSDQDFCQLAAEARELGISIVLDAVLSHTGADSRYFNAAGHYAELGAAQGPASPYYGWFDFEHPCEAAPYRCWWGDPTLPEVEERNESWQRYILGQEGILARWLAAGARGYRLDVADEIPDEVLEGIRESIKSANPDAVVIGEVWEDATTKEGYGTPRTYALGRALDSVMNYPLRSALLGFALGTVDAYQLVTFLKLQQANYPAPMHACLMNLLSSHDVERMRSVLALGGAIKQLPRDGQVAAVDSIDADADARAAELQRMIVALLYALPGAPCVYYGDERGLQGGGDPFCRATFPWSDDGAEMSHAPGAKLIPEMSHAPGAVLISETASESEAELASSASVRRDCGIDLTAFYQRIGKLRKETSMLKTGACAYAAPNSDLVCVVRADESGVAITAANRSEREIEAAFDAFGPDMPLPESVRAQLHFLEPQAATLISCVACENEQVAASAAGVVVNADVSAFTADAAVFCTLSCEDGVVRLRVPARSTACWLPK